MQLNETFEVDSLPVSSGGDFAPLPAGWYSAKIAAADLTPTKSGTGEYIKLKMSVLGPTHQGRVLFSNINIRNASTKAEEIGRAQLGEIMRAIGVAKLSDTDQLIGGEVSVKVEVKDDPTYGPGNEVKAYKGLDSGGSEAKKPFGPNQGGTMTSNQSTSTTSPSNGKASPPWAKR